jgi:hypothetical protein
LDDEQRRWRGGSALKCFGRSFEETLFTGDGAYEDIVVF